MPLTVELPSAEEAQAGIAARFKYRADGVEMAGDVVHSPTGLAVTRIEVRGTSPQGIKHRLFRALPLGAIIAEVQASLTPPSLRATERHPLPPGRTAMTDDLLQQVAIAYLDESGPGKDRAVIHRLAHRFGRPQGTVRTWVWRARQEGWLGPGTRGRKGAAPGYRLLAARKEREVA